MPTETKSCEACGQEIGANETACPKCKVVFAELEEDLTTFGRLRTIDDKRREAAEAKKKAEEEKNKPPEPEKKKKKGLFGRTVK
jgi:methionyl-tRNA synthetase